MKNRLICSIAALAFSLTAFAQPYQGAPKFHGAFKEDFSGKTSEFFNYNFRRNADDFRYYSGHPSLSEPGTSIMMYRIDPNDPAGAGKGPEIISKDYTFYGSYSARIKVPKAKDVQPDLGAVVGYFTYNIDPEIGQSEIDIEWLLADPRIIYVGTWTGKEGAHNRVGRIINLATGEIMETIYKSDIRGPEGNVTKIPRTAFKGKQNQPETIAPIEGYDASEKFYVYGWDWYPDRLTWWMEHPETGDKIILWDYKGKKVFRDQPSKTGVPCVKSKYRLNFWHTNNWPVETNAASIEAPKYPFELEIDWMAYEPFDELNPDLKK